MKIMITGAGGFLGSRLLSFYGEKYEVRGMTHRELDVTDSAKTLDAVGHFCPDVLIHCSAVSDVGTCEREPERSFAVNVTGSENLAAACAQTGAKLVLCSSDQVYFGNDGAEKRDFHERAAFLRPHREDERLDPQPLYGKQKLLAEERCLAVLPSCVCLRLTWMYDVLTLKEREGGRRNLATIFLEAMEQKEPVVFSEMDHRGVTDVNLVVQNMEKAWKLSGGVYNYGSSAGGSVYETMCRAAALLKEQAGRTVRIRNVSLGSLRNLTMDTKKAEAAGIWFPETADRLAEFLAACPVNES